MVDTAGDTETDAVLKGVVRAERLETPEDYIDAMREHIAAQYKLPKDGDNTWTTSIELMEMIARRSGRLLKGGDPCLRSAAITLINDFQRGRLPHYVGPPELKEEEETAAEAAAKEAVGAVEQNLETVGEEHMDKGTTMDDGDVADNESDNDGDKKMKATEAGGSEDEDDEEQEAPSTTLIGSGDWDD